MTEHDNSSTWDPKTRIRRVKVHRDIYNAYVELYRSACIMTQKMDEVLDHFEHQRLISTGTQMGYRMPDVEAVAARNAIIKIYLDGLNPYHGVYEHDGMVEFPARTASQMHLVARHSAMMIADVVNNINQSDYMLWIRNLKKVGGAYQGPTSLQEVFNVWMNLAVSHAQERRHVPEQGRRLPENWIRYVV